MSSGADSTFVMTDEEFLAGFEAAVKQAIAESFRAGRWVVYAEGDQILKVYPDGRREVIGPLYED